MSLKSDYKTQAPLGYLIHEVARLMKRRFEDEASMQEITLPQWRALAHVSNNDGMTQKSLAKAVDTDPMTMSGILDRLEKRGLIERYTDPTDSRAKLARVTKQGTEVVSSARKVGLAMYESALEGVSAEDREIVVAVLARMRGNLIGQTAELEEV
jgi:DNA-binding MarR family transcriptional regulator